MSTSRATSQHQFGRKRSNTAQSILRPAPAPPAAPLQVGDTKIFTVWVHDPKEDPHVIINHAAWPGILAGDVLYVTSQNPEATTGFLCRVRPDDGVQKPQLQVLINVLMCPWFLLIMVSVQISVPKPVAETIGLRNNSEILARKACKLSGQNIGSLFT
jgi:DEP domain-containing protein 5